MANKKIILDLDTGIDDALALAYALGSPECELIGITATYGNVLVETGVRNDLALLQLFGHPEVPVYPGRPHALQRENFAVQEISAFIHGKNGIGEVEIPDAKTEPQRISAVEFLIESVNRYGDDLVIVPTGAMTNIAAAIQESGDFAANAHIVFMGGALTVPGNVTPWSEANISQDPEAADIMLRKCSDTTMVGLDVTLRTLLTNKETAQWRSLNRPAGDFLADATDYYIKAYETTSPHLGGCGLHDPLAVAAALDPSLIETIELNMKVDCEGVTRGRTIGDEQRLNAAATNTRVAVGVDVPRFLDEFMQRLENVIKSSL
ncbi:MAG: nucleoside hydrolase [Corynebacterium sp.]|nr:nucleoside hydrolase [Corynebacterium sp.]